MNTLLETNGRRFELKRLPLRKKELLRAWDAADEYVLSYLSETIDIQGQKLLLINDDFGALAVALHQHHPMALSDSFLSQQATRLNLTANDLPEEDVVFFDSLNMPNETLDLVIIKAPKTLAFLEDILIRLKPVLKPDSKLIIAGMVKNMPSSIWKLAEKLIGSTTTSLAKKKAKLIFITPNPDLVLPKNPYPVNYQLEGTDFSICNHSNVFSRDSLDIGTRFFLQHLPQTDEVINIADLGCGNGVLGLMAAENNPQAKLFFVDESFMAVASAKENFQRVFAESREVVFQVGNGLEGFASNTIDLVLCNPPFHQQNTVGDQIASVMFRQAKNVLKPLGELWVIGNRHLKYHHALKRLFAKVDVVTSNAKFVIYQCQNGKSGTHKIASDIKIKIPVDAQSFVLACL